MTRPKDAQVCTSESGRMRAHKEGGWVRRTEYEEWRNYALALESKLRKSEIPVDRTCATR